MAKKLAAKTDEMFVAVQQDCQEVDAFMAELEASLQQTRLIFGADEDAGEQRKVEAGKMDVDWDAVYEQASERDFSECPICIMPLYEGKQALMLLSCGHVFHGVCIGNFERFDTQLYTHCCPCCRQHYQKLELPHN